MSTLTKNATPAELEYDRALSEWDNNPSEDTAEILWLAKIQLKRERRRGIIEYDRNSKQYQKMLAELNRNLDYGQGRRMESHYFSDKAAVICLLAMGAIWFIAWLMR